MLEWCSANGVKVDARANKATIIETVRGAVNG